MSSQNHWQYPNTAAEDKNKPLPKPVPQPQMARPHQPNLLQPFYQGAYEKYDKYDGKFEGAPANAVNGSGGQNSQHLNPSPQHATNSINNINNISMQNGPGNYTQNLNGGANMIRHPGYNVPMHAYGVPGEMTNNYGNFQMHADQWDQFAMGVRHPSASGTSGPGGASMSPITPSNDPKTRPQGSHGSLSSDSQDEGAKDEFEPDTAQVGAGKVAKRSRMGCLTCRQRKKRCCETRPKCTECLRLRLTCTWPKPGTEHKNKPKEVKSEENTIDHDVYGKIKVLRGIVEYRSDA